MRTELQLLQSALGCETLKPKDITKILKKESRYIKLFSVVLPDRFKGLPSVWYFGILSEGQHFNDEKEVIDEAETLIMKFIAVKDFPVVFLSDDIRIRFEDELEFITQPVFFLNKFDLHGKDSYPRNAKDAAILLSVRNKFARSEPSFFLSPYLPNKPVTDWKFFGRKKELKEIVESQTNCFVIGSRRIGKTSLLQEVRRQLEKSGEHVYWIECQHAEKIHEIVDKIVEHISYRDYYQIQQTGKAVDFQFLSSVLKRLKGDKKNIVLIFDEIGNVIAKNQNNDSWRFIGMLRELSHSNEIRVIASAFQEVIMRQLGNYEGPFVNFGDTVKLGAFTKNEIEDLLISPLIFWGNVRDRGELANKVKKLFGAHPLILQFLGKKLFELLVVTQDKYIDDFIDDIFNSDAFLHFDTAVNDIYIKIDSYLEKYIFLKICIDIDSSKKDLINTEITPDTIKIILDERGIESDFDSRILLLERLSLRGLLMQSASNKLIYKIVCPLVYHYLKRYYSPLDQLKETFAKEIHMKTLNINDL